MRQVGWCAGVAVAAAATLGATLVPAAGPTRHTVRPGESIQAAVDAARPGDTVVVAPGTYRESVRINKDGVRLRGSGTETVLVPASGTQLSSCARDGHGICVTGTPGDPVTGVSVRSLTLSGFRQHGLWASRTEGLAVEQVIAEKNGTWGIAQQRSVKSLLRGNTVRANGDAGLFVANAIDAEGGAIDTGGTLITGNRSEDNRIGLTVRRVRNLTIRTNEISGNCAGVFVVGDETKPYAGAMTLRGNVVRENNKRCPATPRLPVLQGSGIVLTGSEATVIRDNQVIGNVGTAPMSGGIVLVKSFVGATNTDNVIERNEVRDNSTADLVNQGGGSGNTFRDNDCRTSTPAGMCA
ncbi:nitrous oxide reductase family maturation protein NosD [Streptomyces sp. NPDC057638]|uniref:right-handed parallel beta-helix repeat-containing protein n=1 Tax=Streptomyces sp. NPDC057638 TaxID=3346190 RepID=UPI0036C2195E